MSESQSTASARESDGEYIPSGQSSSDHDDDYSCDDDASEISGLKKSNKETSDKTSDATGNGDAMVLPDVPNALGSEGYTAVAGDAPTAPAVQGPPKATKRKRKEKKAKPLLDSDSNSDSDNESEPVSKASKADDDESVSDAKARVEEVVHEKTPEDDSSRVALVKSNIVTSTVVVVDESDGLARRRSCRNRRPVKKFDADRLVDPETLEKVIEREEWEEKVCEHILIAASLGVELEQKKRGQIMKTLAAGSEVEDRAWLTLIDNAATTYAVNLETSCPICSDEPDNVQPCCLLQNIRSTTCNWPLRPVIVDEDDLDWTDMPHRDTRKDEGSDSDPDGDVSKEQDDEPDSEDRDFVVDDDEDEDGDDAGDDDEDDDDEDA